MGNRVSGQGGWNGYGIYGVGTYSYINIERAADVLYLSRSSGNYMHPLDLSLGLTEC